MWVERSVGTVSEFTKYVLEHPRVRDPAWGRMLFRGQANADWGLESQLMRSLSRDHNRDVRAAHFVEREAAAHFWTNAHRYLSANVVLPKKHILDEWALMAHHGVATRLVDWTESPFVAAYFAVLGAWSAVGQCDGVVWMLSADRLASACTNRYGARPAITDSDESRAAIEMFYFSEEPARRVDPFVTRFRTARIAAQRSYFTVSTSAVADHASAIAELMDDELGTDDLERIVISSYSKKEFMDELRFMGITAETLFPGLDGLARSVTELMDAQMYRAKRANMDRLVGQYERYLENKRDVRVDDADGRSPEGA